MPSNTATAVATTLIGAACGLLGGLALGGRANEPVRRDIDSSAARPQTPPALDSSAIDARLSELQQGLADVKALVAGLAAPGGRTPVVPDSPASTASEPADNSPDQERLKAIELELAAIRETIKEQVWVQSPPTYEEIRGATDTNWSEVRRFRDSCMSDFDSAKASLLGRSYAEVLSQFGRPSTLQPTKWWYTGRESGGGFVLEFVNGFVGGMGAPN